MAGRGAAAKSHQEDVAGRGAVAELMAGLGAEAELLAESAMEKRMAALWQRAIGKMLAGRGAVAEILQPGRAIGKMLLAGAPWRSYWPGHRCGRDTTGQERRGRAAGRQLLEGITTQKKESDP